MNMGKQLLKNMTKKAVKGTAKKAVKSVVKRKKVKGKDVAKKMLGGGEDKGGALVKSIGGSSIVPSRGGALSKSSLSPVGDDVVGKSSKVANDLGLNSFMDSLSGIQTNVSEIKNALKDNKKSAEDRLEDQRLLTAKIKKEDREAELEAKKPKKKKGPLNAAKKVADDFLGRMAKFATMTLLGSLIAALMGGAKDVILAFRIGIEAYKKGMPTLLKGVKALKSGVDDAFKLALKPFKALGTAVFEGFKTIGKTIFGWVSKSISNITQGIKNFGTNIIKTGAKVFPKTAQMVTKTTKAAGALINQGKTLAKNTASKAKGFVKNTASKAKGFVKNTAKNVASKAKVAAKNVASKAQAAAKPIVSKAQAAAKPVVSKVQTAAKPIVSKVKTAAKPVVSKIGKIIGKLFGKQAGKAAAGPGIKTLFKAMAKGAKAIKIPVVGPLLVALMSMFAGDPMKQTLFKTAGAAIGGGLGLALGPIGMIVGEIAGEFVGDVLYTGFSGEAGGWKEAGKKLKDKFMQIVKGGKVVLDWVTAGFGRFIESFKAENKVLGQTNWLALLNFKKTTPLLVKSFFPSGEKKEESTEAKIGENGDSNDASDISESASYEDGAEDTTVVVDGGGGDQAASGGSSGEESNIIVSPDKQTIVNSQYEMQSTAALYKV